MRVCWFTAVLVFGILSIEVDARSEILRWTDDQGRLHFTNKPETIPWPHWHQPSPERPTSSGPSQPPSRFTRVPLDQTRSAILVPVEVNGHHRIPFFLDTGATYCQITPEDMRILKLDANSGPSVKILTADGYLADSQAVTLDSLQIGSMEIRKVKAVVGDLRLLGLNVLKRFRVTLDLARGEMILERGYP